MFRKLCIIFLSIAMIFVFSACGSSDQSSDDETTAETGNTETVTGGWEIADNEEASLPEEVGTAFAKATEQFTGSDLKPVAYVANQVVAGMNYMVLCEAETATEEPETSYQMIIIYADPEGNAEITAVKDFDLGAYTEEGNTDINAEELAGGWNVPKEIAGSPVPDEAKDAFDKAAAESDGSEIEPIALLGTQVVAGTNYAFICKSTLTTQEPVSGIQIITVYADLDGNAEITNISTLDPADYNE